MYTVAVGVTLFFVVLGFAMILISETSQLRQTPQGGREKVSPAGLTSEILGGTMVFAGGLFAGAALLPNEPQQALRAFARPEVLLQTAGAVGSASVEPVSPPDASKIVWDGGARTLKFEAPPAGHFWVLSYNSTRIPLAGAATQNVPAGVDRVEIYIQRQNPPATSPAVPIETK